MLRRQLREQGAFGAMIGNSPEMRKIYHIIEQAAPTDASVLISGESGTGKELVAQTIHRLSPRGDSPYVPINCAAIPETLLESELFGHEKGAFTGAMERRPGCFELANHGTIFLDEIAEMTPPTQVKLLRVLQERSVPAARRPQRAGRGHPRHRRDQRRSARGGAARAGCAKICSTASTCSRSACRRSGIARRICRCSFSRSSASSTRATTAAVAAVDERAMRILERYSWPGNVRELRNVMERATIVADGRFIEAKDLPTLVDSGHAGAPGAGLHAGTTVEEAERQLILLTLQHTNDNKTRAAELLGISLKTLHNKLNRLKIKKQEGVALIPCG